MVIAQVLGLINTSINTIVLYSVLELLARLAASLSLMFVVKCNPYHVVNSLAKNFWYVNTFQVGYVDYFGPLQNLIGLDRGLDSGLTAFLSAI